MRVKYSPPGVEFERLSFVRKATLFCRSIARQSFRFPIFFVTFLVFCLLLLGSLAPRGTAPGWADPRGPVDLRNARAERRLREGLDRCPQVHRPQESMIRTSNGPWQRHGSRNGSEEIIAYSAFFDDRPLLGFNTWIRILAVATNVTSRSGEIFCQVWYTDRSAPYVTPAQVNVTGRETGYAYRRKRYVQYLFSCLLAAVEPVPSHVSVVAGNQCDRSTILLPVERPLRAEPEHEFGVCVPVSFGSLPVQGFVEWMELLHMLGVAEFNVYDGGVTGLTEAFRLYSDRGWLRVFPAPPALDLPGVDRFKVGSAAALNDCMMRNVYRYRLLLVVDLDEVIFPRMHRSYSAMLEHVNRAKKLDLNIGYSFQNAYFFLEVKPDRTQPAYLRTAVHRTRSSKLRTYRVAPKSFVDPLQCLSVFNHFCFLPLKVRQGASHLDVHPTVAVTHHYRRCSFSKTVCREFYNSSYEDDTALRFKNDLEPRVKVTLEQLGLPIT